MDIKNLSSNSRWLLVMVACFSLGTGTYWVLLNLFLKEAGYAEGFIGQITGFISVGSILATIPIAWISGRFPIKWILIASVISNVIGDFFLVYGGSEALLRTGAIISGIGIAAWITGVSPFIMRNAIADARTKMFSYKHGIAMGASGFAAIAFAQFVDVQVAGGATPTNAYSSALLIATLVKSFAAIFGLLITAQQPLPEERRDLRDFITARDYRALFKLIGPMALIGLGAGMTMPFMNLYFRERFNTDAGTIGVYFFACTVFMVIGTLYGPKLAMRRGNIRTVVLTQFLSLPFMFILAFTGNLGLALIAFFARATLMNMGHPLYHHFSMELVEEKEQTTTNAFMGLAWNSGWFLGSWLGGISIEMYGFTPSILATAGCYFLATMTQQRTFRKRSLLSIGQVVPPAPHKVSA